MTPIWSYKTNRKRPSLGILLFDLVDRFHRFAENQEKNWKQPTHPSIYASIGWRRQERIPFCWKTKRRNGQEFVSNSSSCFIGWYIPSFLHWSTPTAISYETSNIVPTVFTVAASPVLGAGHWRYRCIGIIRPDLVNRWNTDSLCSKENRIPWCECLVQTNVSRREILDHKKAIQHHAVVLCFATR